MWPKARSATCCSPATYPYLPGHMECCSIFPWAHQKSSEASGARLKYGWPQTTRGSSCRVLPAPGKDQNSGQRWQWWQWWCMGGGGIVAGVRVPPSGPTGAALGASTSSALSQPTTGCKASLNNRRPYPCPTYSQKKKYSMSASKTGGKYIGIYSLSPCV